jgi:hypothetical protein
MVTFTAGRAGQQQDLMGTGEESVSVASSSGVTAAACVDRLNIFPAFPWLVIRQSAAGVPLCLKDMP